MSACQRRYFNADSAYRRKRLLGFNRPATPFFPDIEVLTGNTFIGFLGNLLEASDHVSQIRSLLSMWFCFVPSI